MQRCAIRKRLPKEARSFLHTRSGRPERSVDAFTLYSLASGEEEEEQSWGTFINRIAYARGKRKRAGGNVFENPVYGRLFFALFLASLSRGGWRVRTCRKPTTMVGTLSFIGMVFCIHGRCW